MNISINQISSGIALKVDDQIYLVTDYNHVKPGKGSAFVRVKLKNMRTDLVVERTFRSAETLEEVPLDEKRAHFTYRDGDTFHFMDQETFEEISINKEFVGEAVKYLQDNAEVTIVFCDHKVQKVYLPNFIIAQITEAEPGFKGDSSRAGNKPAKIDTGATVQVPLFINPGDWIKIDTRSDQYVERVQK